ncbi:MAG TPA: TetR/AcrR family transcriptional regulator [Stellaceae bacterium]|jgi:AcrR family transcriptional regulator|nr:TetR/AcrR family transcriptional regulator [Stellaceae bacterium]
MVKNTPQSDPTTDASGPEPVPRRRARETRESEILEAAFEEFAAAGYAATRLEDVARRAGVAKGLPSFYFESKEALFKAVLRRVVLPDWDMLEARFEQSDERTAEALRRLIAAVYERLVENPRARRLLRLLIAEGPRFPELTEFYHAELVARALALLRRLLARGVERGEVRPGPALEYPQTIMAPALMAALWQLLFAEHHPLDLARFFEAHLDLVANGWAPG